MDPAREHLYETFQRLGAGVTVMKAFGGGDLLSEELSPAGKALTVAQCLHYALTRPAVACVMAAPGAWRNCGACEKRCPFHVPIMEHMRQARETFGR